jgi:uncharacterized protein YegP (UPF0339 family)
VAAQFQYFRRKLPSSGGWQWFWRLVSGNGKKIAVGGEGYHNKIDCLAAVQLVKDSAALEVKEVEK